MMEKRVKIPFYTKWFVFLQLNKIPLGMELKIQNVNKIKSADIKLNGLTVIVGENDSGKSTVGRVLFSVVKSLVNTKVNNVRKQEKQLEKHVQSLFRRLASVGIGKYSIAGSNRKISPLPRNSYELVDELKKAESIDEYIEDISLFLDDLETTPRIKSLMKEDLSLIKICMKEEGNRAAKLFTEFRYLVESEFLNQFGSDNIGSVSINLLSDENSKSFFSYSAGEEAIESHCENEESLEDITYVETPLYLHMLDSLMYAGAYREVDKRRRNLFPMIPYHIKDFVEKMNASRSFLGSEGQFKLFFDNPIDTANIIGGKFSYDNNRKSIVFVKDDMSILPLNTASGIKSFGVLQMLLEGGFIDANRPLIWDEPENHLHPEWQIEFAKVIVQIYKSGVPVVITTHSPYFLQAIRYYSAKEKVEDFVSYYMAQPTEHNLVEMEDVTKDLNRVFKKLAAPLTEIMNVDAARKGLEL